ncbi:B- and T-lymphocyte attenuator [Carassius gibelio]|uniref:B- and T-lymphocyte attenuator n=1 Tax=Carassius gibelio TaxID=101364 RepID=UPI0022789E9A|nr:B- and T-lymphocyte attenuator [Carassius gibelio]
MDSAYLRKSALTLYMLVVFILHVSIDTQGVKGQAPTCPLLKVHRGTVHKAFINRPFKISCNLTYCDEQTVNVTWTKQNMREWIPISGADQISTSQNYSSSDPNMLTSYLTFTNISKHHEGSYRCELNLPDFSMNSHHINVSVSDNITEYEMTIERDNTDSSSGTYPWWLPYLSICLGVLILVLIVMLISILCINGSTSSRRKNAQRSKVQYTATSVWSSSSPIVLKRDDLVCGQELQKHSRDSNSCSLTLQSGQSTSHVSDCSDDPLSERKDSRSSQVVYASLHHLAPKPSSTTSRETQEEFSEYASIRVF